MRTQAVDLARQTDIDDERATPCPPYAKKRMERSASAIKGYEPVWDECLSFFDGEQYVERNATSGQLQRVETREGSPTKPRYRSRLIRNRYTPAIEAEIAAAISRVPVPECSAPSGNYEAGNAALFAEKACLSAHARLHMKTMAWDVLTYTFNCGAGYLWPYWNGSVGEFITDPVTGDVLRTGEVGFWILSPRDVLWEPGVPFKESRWYAVRKARPLHEVIEGDNYTGPKELKADAMASPFERGRDATNDELVFVYHYLERPSKKHEEGRWLQIAGGVQIAEEALYPCTKDVPIIHELADIRRPHRDRPLGRGEMMIDVQRTYNRTINQIIAWKNLVLNPQMLAPKGSIRTEVTEEPGSIIEYRPIGGAVPQWRTVPEIPVGLFKTLDQCIEDWREITGQHELPTGMTSGTGVQAINERDTSRRAAFIGGLAEWYSDVFQHILYLMQKHYTEPRLMEFKGRFGRESFVDFLGASIMEGITVRVDPGSIEPRTRAAQEAKLVMYADRGWLQPHQVMAALKSGNADSIIDDFELDVAKANREIQQLIAMGRGEGPGVPFAAPSDNHQIQKDVIGAWMKTEDFERQADEVKQAAMLHYQQHDVEMQILAFQEQLAQANMAAQQGQANAARPGEPGQDVSRPSLESNVAGVQGVAR